MEIFAAPEARTTDRRAYTSKKTSTATRKSTRIGRLNPAELLAVSYAVAAHPAVVALPRTDRNRDWVRLAAVELATNPESTDTDGLAPALAAAAHDAAETVRATIRSRPGLRSSHTGSDSAWHGALRTTAKTPVWVCDHNHANRDRDYRSMGRLVPAAKTCALHALAKVLAGQLALL